MKKKIVMKQSGDILINEGLKNFIQQKEEDECSADTIKNYTNFWNLFEEFYSKKNICYVKEINKQLVTDYRAYMRKKQTLNETSINTNLRHIKVVINYFIGKEWIEYFEIKISKIAKAPKELYTDEEIEKLLKKPDKNCSFPEFRNWVIICYVLATGNRINTFLNLRVKDVDMANGIIKLGIVKNGKPYVIPINDTFYSVLRRYLKERAGEPDDYLFCNQYGAQLTTGGWKTAIKRYNKKRGVNKTSTHLLRHNFATSWVLSDGNPKKLQFMLGHSTSAMVDEYVSIYGTDLKNEVDTFSPLCKFKDIVNKEKIKMGK